jgi:hypothetical protein
MRDGVIFVTSKEDGLIYLRIHVLAGPAPKNTKPLPVHKRYLYLTNVAVVG